MHLIIQKKKKKQLNTMDPTNQPIQTQLTTNRDFNHHHNASKLLEYSSDGKIPESLVSYLDI